MCEADAADIADGGTVSATVPVGVRATVPAEAGAALATVPADVGVIARRDADTVRTAVPVGVGAVAPVRPPESRSSPRTAAR